MASEGTMTRGAAEEGHGSHGEHGRHDPPFWKKYLFSTDHKVIGIQYGITALFFLLFGFVLVMLMRYSIAYPGKELPLIGAWFGEKWAPGGVMTGEFYNSLGAMHGTIMVFLGIVPLGFGAFGNYFTPLQIGAPDMAFPRLNMASYWLYLAGGLMMLASFFFPSGAAQTGWTAYPPLSVLTNADSVWGVWFTGQTMWLVAMVVLITSSLLGAVNFLTTIIQLRAPGMTWMRLPFFVWSMLVTGFLLLLAFPPLEVAGIMQLMDRVAGTSFFLPSGLNVNGQVPDIAGSGSPLLYQHLFWFLGHPEVYVLLLPAFGIVAEVLPPNIRKPLWGYKPMVYSVLVLGFLSFIVWAHHMYLTGMGPAVSTFFQTTTVLISIPSVIIITSLFITLWGGSIRFPTAMLFATAFLPMFGIGGLTGLPLAFTFLDLQLHDTYYVIGHFHYVVAPGIIFAFYAGIYHWFPKMTGRRMNEFLGKLHFWPSLVLMNCVFFPMFIQGMAGFHRRWYDGGITFPKLTEEYLWLNPFMSISAWLLALAQIPFIINLFSSIWRGAKVESENPWNATTLEWATPTPPPHGNFDKPIAVYRGPYEYSVPGQKDTDFLPQWKQGAAPPPPETEVEMGVQESKPAH